jgi:hydrogenase-4 component F
MLLIALIALPLAFAGLAWFAGADRQRAWMLPLCAAGHLALTLVAVRGPEASSLGGWMALDPPGRIVLLLLSVLFAICAVYAVGYLRYRRELSNRVFVPCLLGFLAMTSFPTASSSRVSSSSSP